jgi:hypothetical protein
VLQVGEREDRLAKEARLDGIFILQSTAAGLAATEIVNAYKQLLAVERAFRTLKSFLHVRRVFHFSERRIRAHFLLCIPGLPAPEPSRPPAGAGRTGISARAALEALETLKLVDYELPVQTSRRIRVFTKPRPEALAVIAKLGLKLPSQLTLPSAA